MDETCFVYFIVAGDGPIKIGISSSPKDRLYSLATAHYKTLRLIHTIECQNRSDALDIEAGFHRWYAEKRLRNEWFDIPMAELLSDLELIEKLTKTNARFTWHESKERVEGIAIRQGTKSKTVTNYLNEFPEDAALPSRVLAEKVSEYSQTRIGHDAVNRARNAWRNSTGS